MARFKTVALTAVRGSVSSTPQERRVAMLTKNMAGSLEGWTAKDMRVSEHKDQYLRCDATHGRAYVLVVVTKGDTTRAVGLGFAAKYLGIELERPDIVLK